MGGVRRLFDLQVASTFRCLKKTIDSLELNNNYSVLDVGCGDMPYRKLFPKRCNYLGIDTYSAAKDFDYKRDDVKHYDGRSFPIEDESVDIVLHSEVMEHIYDSRFFLSECYRVLKKGGTMVFTIPFQARYHYIPNDYWRFTPSCIESLLRESKFSSISIDCRGNDIAVAAYKSVAIGYRLFFSMSWWRMIISAIMAPIWIISLIIGQISIHYNVGSKDDCLGFVVSCSKAE